MIMEGAAAVLLCNPIPKSLLSWVATNQLPRATCAKMTYANVGDLHNWFLARGPQYHAVSLWARREYHPTLDTAGLIWRRHHWDTEDGTARCRQPTCPGCAVTEMLVPKEREDPRGWVVEICTAQRLSTGKSRCAQPIPPLHVACVPLHTPGGSSLFSSSFSSFSFLFDAVCCSANKTQKSAQRPLPQSETGTQHADAPRSSQNGPMAACTVCRSQRQEETKHWILPNAIRRRLSPCRWCAGEASGANR